MGMMKSKTHRLYKLSDEQIDQIRTLIEVHERVVGNPPVTPYNGLRRAIDDPMPDGTVCVILQKCGVCGGTGEVPIVSSAIHDEGNQKCFHCYGAGHFIQLDSAVIGIARDED